MPRKTAVEAVFDARKRSGSSVLLNKTRQCNRASDLPLAVQTRRQTPTEARLFDSALHSLLSELVAQELRRERGSS